MFNNNKKSYLELLEREAEQTFLHYDGFDDGYDEDFYEDYDEDFYEDYDEDYDDYNGVPAGKLGVSDKTLAITIINNNPDPTPATILGAFKNLSVANFGLPAGIVVDVPDSSYAQLLNEIASNPMGIKGVKIIVSNALQFNNTLQFVKKEATGAEESDPLVPSRYLSALQNQGNIVDMPGIRFPLDGKLELRSTFIGNSTTQLILNVTSKVDIGRVAYGKSVIRTSKRRRPRK